MIEEPGRLREAARREQKKRLAVKRTQANLEQQLGRIERESADIAARLTDLEKVIERGVKTFAEVGLALLEIRDRRLYRESHATFKDYCRERWGFGDSRARQLILAAKEVQEHPERYQGNGQLNERQVREIARARRSPSAEAVAVEEAGYEPREGPVEDAEVVEPDERGELIERISRALELLSTAQLRELAAAAG